MKGGRTARVFQPSISPTLSAWPPKRHLDLLLRSLFARRRKLLITINAKWMRGILTDIDFDGARFGAPLYRPGPKVIRNSMLPPQIVLFFLESMRRWLFLRELFPKRAWVGSSSYETKIHFGYGCWTTVMADIKDFELIKCLVIFHRKTNSELVHIRASLHLQYLCLYCDVLKE